MAEYNIRDIYTMTEDQLDKSLDEYFDGEELPIIVDFKKILLTYMVALNENLHAEAEQIEYLSVLDKMFDVEQKIYDELGLNDSTST